MTELCEDLAPEFEVTVIAGQPNHNPDQGDFVRHGWQQRRGVAIRRVRHTRFSKTGLLGRAVNMLSYLTAAALAGLTLRRQAMIVVETDPPLLCLLGALLRLRHRARLVVYLQDIYPDVAVALQKLRPGVFTWLLRRLFFAIYRSADRVVVLSRDMRALLIAGGVAAERIVCIPNWVDTRSVYPRKVDNPLRAEQALDDRFVVMYSGNMGLSQRLEVVLDAAAELQDVPEIVLLMIGDGASRARLEALAREQRLSNVRFLPYRPKSELAASLSAADLHLVMLDPALTQLLMPSKIYGVLAAGVASLVIADPGSELAEMTQLHATGLVVPPGDAAALASAVRWAAAHGDELAAMGLRARKLAETQYDRRRATAAFAEVLEKLKKPASQAENTPLEPETYSPRPRPWANRL